MLDNMPPYRGVLEWIHQQDRDLVTCADIVEYWKDHFPEALLLDEKTSKGHVVSFLHLCHAAEIGGATQGRKGQPSRLRVDREELAAHIRGRPREDWEPALAEDRQLDLPRLAAIGPASSRRLCVFISTPKGLGIVDSIHDALGIADIDSEVVERDTGCAKLVSERTFKAMRRCDAGIVIVNYADCIQDAAGKDVLNQTALIEIGAAFVHFARRLVLLHGTQVRLPFSLDDFCHYEFEGSKLTWETGLRLVKTVKLFKTGSRPIDTRGELASANDWQQT